MPTASHLIWSRVGGKLRKKEEVKSDHSNDIPVTTSNVGGRKVLPTLSRTLPRKPLAGVVISSVILVPLSKW